MKIETGYTPMDWQLDAHLKFKRRNFFLIHRRGGKTIFGGNHIIHAAYNFNKKCPKTGKDLMNPTYAYVASTIKSAKKIVWDNFKKYCKGLPGYTENSTELKITFQVPRGTCTIYVFGAENYDSLVGMGLDGYILDEASLYSLSIVRDRIMLPMISDREGWELITGTIRGYNEFKKLMDRALQNPDEWYVLDLPVTKTKMITKVEQKTLKENMTEEAWEQEYMNNPQAIPTGYFYQKQIEQIRKLGQVGSFPWNPDKRVITAWDLGRDTTAIWFLQIIKGIPRVINYYHVAGAGLPEICKELNKMPYVWGMAIFPHDVKYTDLVSNKSRLDYLVGMGFKNYYVVPKTECVEEDTHAVRQVIPVTMFHYSGSIDGWGTEDGIESLMQYRRKYDEILQVYSKDAIHDEFSHGADAYRQFCMAWVADEIKDEGFNENPLPQEAEHDYNMFDMNSRS
jgi:hypothetical protein